MNSNVNMAGARLDPSNVSSNSGSSPEQLAASLKTLRKVRGGATLFFTTLSQYYSQENTKENSDNNVVKKKEPAELETQVQTELDDLLKNIKSFQVEVSGLSPQLNSSIQSNLDLLSLDPGTDKQHLHHKLRQCYIWMDKVHNYGSLNHSLLSQSQLTRSHMPIHSGSISKRRRTPTTSYNVNVPQQQVDSIIQAMNNLFQDMTLTLTRPMGSNAIVQVTLGRVLRGVLTLRGLLIEGVIIRGYNETNLDKYGKVDLFKQSQLVVYQRVTDNACAAMLHFCSPYFVDLSIRSFFTWLHSYNNLFSQPCTKCGYTINNSSPPTWREFRTLLPYHQNCRP